MNLSFVRGQKYEATGTHKDSAGTPVNVTGWTIMFTMRLKPDFVGSPMLSKACTIVVGASGTYRLSLTSEETQAVPAHTYMCDFWRIDAGYETQLGAGTMTVTKGALFQ